jgi:O-antigen ligase
MRLNNQLLNLWFRNLEVVVTVIWLLYFLDVRIPSPILDKSIRVLAYPILAILVILHWKRFSWVATRDIPLLLLVGTAFASVFWSADPGKTLDGCKGLLRTFLFGAYLATRYSLKEQMKILTWVFGIATILSLVVALAIPSYGTAARLDHPGAWQGIFAHKNILGYAMTIGAILFLLTAIKERKPNWLAWSGFGLAVVLTVLAYSSSALVSLLLLLSLMPVYKLVRQHYKLQVILLSMTCILAASVAIFIFSNLETILVDILQEGLTFNGRTPIWDLIVEKTWERPWLGYGYSAFWESDAGAYVILHTWASAGGAKEAVEQGFNAHSGYFQLLPQLGFLGISLYAISLVTVFIRVFILLLSTKKIEFFWLLQFLVFICVTNVGDAMATVFLSSDASYMSIYVSICLSTAIECKRIKRKRNALTYNPELLASKELIK